MRERSLPPPFAAFGGRFSQDFCIRGGGNVLVRPTVRTLATQRVDFNILGIGRN